VGLGSLEPGLLVEGGHGGGEVHWSGRCNTTTGRHRVGICTLGLHLRRLAVFAWNRRDDLAKVDITRMARAPRVPMGRLDGDKVGVGPWLGPSVAEE
jgi:hypothetical protein